MGISGGPDMIQDGLVLALDASDRNSYVSGSTTWFDLSGNACNGTLTNGPTFSSGSLGSINFDGTNDYIATPGISTSLVNLTISTWVFCSGSQPNDYSSIVYSRTGSPTGLHFLGTSFGGDGFKLSYTYNGSGYTWSGAPSVTNNAWTNICLTFTNNTAAFYTNGVFRASNTETISSTTLSSLNIARDSSVFARYFKGNIANVEIYSRALTASEILQNYNALKSRFNL